MRYLPRLASSLYGYARVCAQGGSDLDDGLAAVQKALQIFERLVEVDPTHTQQLYHTRRAYADLLDAVGRGRESATVRRAISRSWLSTDS